MPTPPSPSEGQIRCQGGQGHSWTPTHAPANYETMWWVTAFDQCTSCQTIRIKHIDANGHFIPYDYKYPPDWVKGYATSETLDERKLAYLARRDPSTFVVNPKIKRKLPRTQNGSR